MGQRWQINWHCIVADSVHCGPSSSPLPREDLRLMVIANKTGIKNKWRVIPEATILFLARNKTPTQRSGSHKFSGKIYGANITALVQNFSRPAVLAWSSQLLKRDLRTLIWASVQWEGRFPIVRKHDKQQRNQKCVSDPFLVWGTSMVF